MTSPWNNGTSFKRIDERHIELHPESRNPVHEGMHIDLAKHIVHIDGVVVGHMRGKASVQAGHEVRDAD